MERMEAADWPEVYVTVGLSSCMDQNGGKMRKCKYWDQKGIKSVEKWG